MKTSHYLDSIQIGRALAALAIVLLHVIKDTDRLYLRYTGLDPGLTQSAYGWHVILAAGVDVFFVISGVVMVLSTAERRPASGLFLYKRAARIFPLYWLLTLVYILALVFLPQLFQENHLDFHHALSSLYLIPSIGPDGVAFPLIYAGWTLTYEIIFYGCFALSLLIPGKNNSLLVCILLVLGWHLLHYTPAADFIAIKRSTENVMLEFLYGVVLAHLWMRRQSHRHSGWPLVGLGLALLAASHLPMLIDLARALSWGLPALLIVAGLMNINPGAGKLSRMLVYLGAASYSIYLFHFFALRVYFMALGKSGFIDRLDPVACVVIGLLFATVASIAVYECLEKPMMKLSRRLLNPRSPVPGLS